MDATLAELYAQIEFGAKEITPPVFTRPCPSKMFPTATRAAPSGSGLECCGQKMSLLPSGTEWVCDKCGFMEANMVESETEYHGAANTVPVAMRIQGPQSQKFQKKLMGSTSDYRAAQKRATYDQMAAYVHRYQGNKIPPNVIQEAVEYYYAMQQQHIIKRGAVREGIMASCMYRKCRELGVPRKPKEIIAIFGISQSDLSHGEKILDDLHARGLLPRLRYVSEEENVREYLLRYLVSLQLPREDAHFAERLVRFTVKYCIAENTVVSTKCAGAVFCVTEKYPDRGVSKEQVAAKCNISKSTFIRFYHALCDVLADDDPAYARVRSRLRRVFKKNGVPLPARKSL